MQKQIRQQIERIKAAGATYIDARWYPIEESNQLLMWNGNLKNASASRESGMGIRVLHKGAWGFSASSDLSNISELFDKALVYELDLNHFKQKPEKIIKEIVHEFTRAD